MSFVDYNFTKGFYWDIRYLLHEASGLFSIFPVIDCSACISTTTISCCCPSQVTMYILTCFRGVDISFGDWSGSHHSEWACAKLPYLGTITKDCVLMENVPEWWDRQGDYSQDSGCVVGLDYLGYFNYAHVWS